MAYLQLSIVAKMAWFVEMLRLYSSDLEFNPESLHVDGNQLFDFKVFFTVMSFECGLNKKKILYLQVSVYLFIFFYKKLLNRKCKLTKYKIDFFCFFIGCISNI